MKRLFVITIFAFLSVTVGFSQTPDFTIFNRTKISAKPGTLVAFIGDFTSHSDSAWLKNVTLILAGDGNQNIENAEGATDSLTISGLTIGLHENNGVGSIKKLFGNFSNSVNFAPRIKRLPSIRLEQQQPQQKLVIQHLKGYIRMG